MFPLDVPSAVKRGAFTSTMGLDRLPNQHHGALGPGDCAAEQALTPNSELRVLPSIAGHFGLFGFEKTYLDAVDTNLSELLARPA